jgi:glutamyl-tRNA reductase
MEQGCRSLITLGASHHTAPIEIRERFSIPPEKLEEVYRRLLAVPSVHEAAVLSTCNRMEIYAVTEARFDPAALAAPIGALQNIDAAELIRHGFERRDQMVVRHLFDVSAGLDSMVIGEAEILGQVKSAYQTACDHKAAGPMLNRLFQKSFQVAKWVRTHTSIGRGQVSVGTVAVDLALKIFGDLAACRILVVGAGEISERTIVALKSRGAALITVCNRTDQKAMDLAKIFGGSALPYERLTDSLGQFDIVVCSTSSPVAILTRDIVREARRKRTYDPLFLIDLALPRDVDPEVGQLENVYLYNIDDLSQIADDNLAMRKAEMERCRELLAARAEDVWRGLTRR